MRKELPTLNRLLATSNHGILKSSFPPTTIPAWMSMFTGKTPGELGVYGFKHRRGHAMTHPIELVSRLDYQAKPVWEWVSRQGLDSVVVGVPSTWPIASLRGAMLSDFTTPPHQRAVYPDAFRRFLPEDWTWDLSDWRNQPREKILDELIALSRRYWMVFRRMLAENPNWALSILVDIGMDRAHHLFWEDAIDAGAAPRSGGPLWKFYKFIDAEIGKFLTTLDDDISLLIVSDHGAQAMKGSFALNQWLLQEGLLSLKDEKCGVIRAQDVDWEKSVWWGEGGYVGKLHISPFVSTSPEILVEKLRERLQAQGLDGTVKLIEPSEVYPEVRGYPPTLFVSVSDLTIRCIGSISEEGTLWPKENDLGADAANHHPSGLFIERAATSHLLPDEPQLQDVYAWIRRRLG